LSQEDYWCLFCGVDGPRWGSSAELFSHMINTVHKDNAGNMVFFEGDSND